jgi:hypothetical protein
VQGVKQRLLGLCIAPVLLCALDCTLTLVGQLPQYWAGNYLWANEGSPTFYQLLQLHPAAFIAGIVVWIFVFVACILLLPDVLALIVSVVVTFGHAAGAASWLYGRFHYGYQLCNGLFLLAAILVGVGIRWGWRATPQGDYRLGRLPWFVRWGLIVLLVGVGVYISLWPRVTGGVSVAASNQGGSDVIQRRVEAVATTDRQLKQLAREPQLIRLCLLGPEISDDGLAHLEQLPGLQNLTLRDLRLSGTSLEHLSGLHVLIGLYLDNVSIADPDLVGLAGLSRLEGASLQGPQVTDAWLAPLCKLSQFRTLFLISTKVTDDGLRHLAGVKQLCRLHIQGGALTDNGLRHLTRLPQLQSLFISEVNISDAGLEHLKGLTRLQSLCLGYTNCTPEGKKKLRQSLPNCRVE